MNHNLHLLQSLYTSTSGKYRKLKGRFDKAVNTGRFQKLNKRKRSFLVSRLKKLYERLKSLHTQLKLASAVAGFAGILSVSSPAQAQVGPFERNDANNPLPPPLSIAHPRPAVVDIDGDGDLDVFVGTVDGTIRFFKNESPAGTVTKFTELTGTDNPLGSVEKGAHAAPTFADVDGDGDFDMLMGNEAANTYFFENTGSGTNPVFTEQTTIEDNPFYGFEGTGSIYGTGLAIPVFVDLDGDLDLDLIIGATSINSDGTDLNAVRYFENTNGTFSPVNDPAVSAPMQYESQVALTFADVDDDGDMDMFAGASGSGIVRFFTQGVENVFSEEYGSWNSVTRTGSPFSGFNFGKYSSPVAADLDGDGDVDFLVGGGSDDDKSNIRYFENTDGAFTLVDRTLLNLSPFGGVDAGGHAAPSFIDLDSDGDLDVLLGSKYIWEISVLINDNGKFIPSVNHPLAQIIEDAGVDYSAKPIFADIDDDGDPDLFVAHAYGVDFFENNAGNFTEEATPINVSGDIFSPSLALIDIDDDGDLDALIGADEGTDSPIYYFRNEGTAEAPEFVSTTAPSPFNTRQFEEIPNIFGVDLDHDGDTDLIVSETYNATVYGNADATRVMVFENRGNGTFSGSSQPLFNEMPEEGFTAFADLDRDGDLDGFVGMGNSFGDNEDGRVLFFENTNPAPETTLTALAFDVFEGEVVVLDNSLTISDTDTDNIVYATVTIGNFTSGDSELGFNQNIADANNISGFFNSETGVLTFSGKATSDVYENLLRTVTFTFTGDASARTSKNKIAAGIPSNAHNISFSVRDVDFTTTTIAVVTVTVATGPISELIVYNAVSPNSDDNLNAYFRIRFIETISPKNKVTIYNRWGDIVFDVNNYNNSESSKRFEGVSNSGKDLPTGTYFYRIETSKQTLTGYLSLKR